MNIAKSRPSPDHPTDTVATVLFFIGAAIIGLTVIVALTSAVIVFVGAAQGVGINPVMVDTFLVEFGGLVVGAIIMAAGLARGRASARRL